METAILIFSIINFLGLVVMIAALIVRTGWITDATDHFENLLTSFGERMESMATATGQIAESKRLSTILTFEGKKDLGIKTEDIEPKKEELRKAVHAVIEEAKHPSPDTWAYCILDKSGIDLFMDSKDKANVRKALGRLLANHNMSAVKGFLTKVVNAL